MTVLYLQSALIHKLAGMFQSKQEKHASMNYFLHPKDTSFGCLKKKNFLGISSEKAAVRLGAASVGVVGFRV